MVYPIKLHKDCLRNQRRSLIKKINQRDRLSDRLNLEIAQDQIMADFYGFQIDEAIKSGKSGFDSGKFRVKRK